MNKPHLILVGSGGQPYREYAFANLAEIYRLSLISSADPTWQKTYIHDFVVADTSSPQAIAEAAERLACGGTQIGILTWDETVLEATAQAAERLGLPHMPAAAAARCRDKYATRSLLEQAGLPSVRHRLVTSADEAVAAANELGYPVVVKARALAGSMGVVYADDDGSVREAFAVAAGASYSTLPTGHGVLVEEYLDGPEINMDAVAFDGTVECVNVARKRVGFWPYFEETGHLVNDWADEPWAEAARELVIGAHRALGVEHGVTHAELRLTAGGPRLVELNGRLGGDLIVHAEWLGTGIDQVRAAAAMAFGRTPDLVPTRDQVAVVRWVFPPHDCVVERIAVDQAAAVPGIVWANAMAQPGDEVLLPPKSALPRLVGLIAVGSDERECELALDEAEQVLVMEITRV